MEEEEKEEEKAAGGGRKEGGWVRSRRCYDGYRWMDGWVGAFARQGVRVHSEGAFKKVSRGDLMLHPVHPS